MEQSPNLSLTMPATPANSPNLSLPMNMDSVNSAHRMVVASRVIPVSFIVFLFILAISIALCVYCEPHHDQPVTPTILAQVEMQHLGVDPTICQRLRKMQYSSQTSQEITLPFGEEKCIWCQFDFCEGEVLTSLPCPNAFHGDCIQEYTSHATMCPICWKVITLPKDSMEASGFIDNMV